MNEVLIGISNPADVSTRFLQAWENGKPQTAQINFSSEEQLWKTLTLERWQILKLMTGAGELSVQEIACRAGRDVKAMNSDVKVLQNCGLLDKTDNGKLIFPYSAVHVDFLLKAA